MRLRWRETDPAAVERRYDSLAPFYAVFETLWLPRGLRARAVERLTLSRGDAVLEVGCGTGSNLRLLVRAVGPDGHVYGVDRSSGMLAVARRRCARGHWSNCELVQSDAADYEIPPVDAALFSLCYGTMAHRLDVLRAAWDHLKPGGRLVIFDAAPPAGRVGALVRVVMFVLSRASVLGNPDVRPWEDLRILAPRVDLTQHHFRTYVIARATKPAQRAG
jgi:demethylmenaquinone methyltransferase/2-methoxy-6-polyprenyl-1,4-benzoquinol methylase